MKTLSIISALSVITLSPLIANEEFKADLKKNHNSKMAKPKVKREEVLKIHAESSVVTADGQDELSADVQDLIQEQTNVEVLELLDDAESLMGEATELLEEQNTSAVTIAIQTEIIEKIYEAAKEKSQEGEGEGSGEANPLMEMMKGMMKGEGKGEGKGEEAEGKGEGSKGGEGSEGTSDKANDKKSGTADNTKEERRVPKNTSIPSQSLPREEQRALDAYNK